jgi:hypothetical protein
MIESLDTLSPADQLGHLLAQIAKLTKLADAIKDDMKNEATGGGDKVFIGSLFRATVIEANVKSINDAALLADTVVRWTGIDPATAEGAARAKELLGLKPVEGDVARHTKVSARFSVKITSL